MARKSNVIDFTDKIEYKKVMIFLLKYANKPDRIVKLFNYKRYRELSKEEPETDSKYGFSEWIKDFAIIVINEKQPPDQKIFTMAHETAHITLGHLSHNLDKSPDSIEWEANLFASMAMFAINGAIPYMEYSIYGVLRWRSERRWF